MASSCRQAGTQRGWWRGELDSNAVAEAWREAGFTPDLVDMEERRLLFRREASDEASQPSQWGDPIPLVQDRHPIFGCMKDVTHLVEGVDYTEPADPDWARLVEEKTL